MSTILNNKDYYPTPEEVISYMAQDIEINGKIIYDPSAGSGNILSYALKHGASQVLASEIDQDLRQILLKKDCRIIGSDFFNVRAEDISHCDVILMNPPFQADERHILHAYEIAPEGCRIVSLCNHNTISNTYTNNREKLKKLIDNYGYSEELGDVFSNALRATNCRIGLVSLFKPRSKEEFEFDGYFDLTEEEELQENGIMQFSEIRNIVNRYVEAVKMFNSVMEVNKTIDNLISPIDSRGFHFGAFVMNDRSDMQRIDRDTFKKELQKSAWRTVFSKLDMRKYLTRGVISDINKFVEKQLHIPFTVGNVKKMIEIIVGTRENIMNKVLVEAFDRICSLSHDNSTAGEGWKTNSNYKVNRRFIDSYVCEFDSRWPAEYTKIRCGHRDEALDDVIKGLCFLTGKQYEDVMYEDKKDQWGNVRRIPKSLYYYFNNNKIEWGQWVQWNDFFRVRGYKKGTMHFEFVDEKVWEEFNLRVAKIKGWQLPTKTDNKKKGTERQRAEGLLIY